MVGNSPIFKQIQEAINDMVNSWTKTHIFLNWS
jgi:hypothetical protein